MKLLIIDDEIQGDKVASLVTRLQTILKHTVVLADGASKAFSILQENTDFDFIFFF